MDPKDYTYTITVRRPFFPIGRRYHVTKHSTEVILNTARLVLTCPDKSVIVIPGIDKKYFKIHADYQQAEANLKALKEPRKPEVVPLTEGPQHAEAGS
jgi:hypothetical protein